MSLMSFLSSFLTFFIVYGGGIMEIEDTNFYLILGDYMTYSEAQQYCQDTYGSYLAEIYNAYQQTELASLIATEDPAEEVWIGLNDMTIEGNYEWSSGENTFDYSNWATDQPTGLGNVTEDCVYTTGNMGTTWYDDLCTARRAFACARTMRYEGANGNYYLVRGNEMNWNDSTDYCDSNYGTSLAEIYNVVQNSEIILLGLDGITPWIGATDQFNTDVYVWNRAKRTIDYEAWADGEPSGGINTCGTIDITGEWSTEACINTNTFICNAGVNTLEPTMTPSAAPTMTSNSPTTIPTMNPSKSPTTQPTRTPTVTNTLINEKEIDWVVDVSSSVNLLLQSQAIRTAFIQTVANRTENVNNEDYIFDAVTTRLSGGGANDYEIDATINTFKNTFNSMYFAIARTGFINEFENRLAILVVDETLSITKIVSLSGNGNGSNINDENDNDGVLIATAIIVGIFLVIIPLIALLYCCLTDKRPSESSSSLNEDAQIELNTVVQNGTNENGGNETGGQETTEEKDNF